MKFQAKHFKFLLLFFLIFIPILIRFTPLGELLGDPNLKILRDFTGKFGSYGPWLLGFLVIPAMLLGVPRSAVYVVCGALFGLVVGLLTGVISTVCGASCIFFSAKLLHRSVPKRVLEVLSRYGFDRDSINWGGVVLIRQLPLPGLLMSLGMGAMNVSAISYLIGSVIGFLPAAIFWTLVGTGIAAEESSSKIKLMFLGLGGLAAVTIIVHAWQKHRLNKRKEKNPELAETC